MKSTILAIDDEQELLEAVRQSLELDGYTVLAFNRPEDGIHCYELHWRAIDLVLLDYVMPGMTGDLVFECLQRVNPDVKVLLLTGCEDHVAHTMFTKGLRGYLQKPFYLADLTARVKEEIATE